MKRVLYFYPHKFSGLTDGIHARIVTLLEYFKSRGITVDMVNFDNPSIQGSYLKEKNLIDNLYLVRDNPLIEKETNWTRMKSFVEQKANSLKRRLLPGTTDRGSKRRMKIPDLMTPSLAEMVEKLSSETKYDAVLITYSYWSEIIDSVKRRNPTIKTVIDPTDFLTLQQFYNNGKVGYFQIGNMFGDEVERVSHFDDIIHISNDELLLFSNFIPQKRHHFIPQFFKPNFYKLEKTQSYDILLIASGNPYNLEGINWFLKEVYPLLDSDITIAIAGNICNKISFDVPNIKKLGFVDSVDDLYRISLCTICPLMKGSGMKIKVIESLSYGKPVVSTSKGIDGFINKDLEGGILVTNNPQKFAEYLSRLKGEPVFYDSQVEQAKLLFEKYFSMDANFKKLDSVFFD